MNSNEKKVEENVPKCPRRARGLRLSRLPTWDPLVIRTSELPIPLTSSTSLASPRSQTCHASMVPSEPTCSEGKTHHQRRCSRKPLSDLTDSDASVTAVVAPHATHPALVPALQHSHFCLWLLPPGHPPKVLQAPWFPLGSLSLLRSIVLLPQTELHYGVR